MKFIYRSLVIFTLLTLLISCKNNTNESTKEGSQVTTDSIVKKERKVLTEAEKAQTISVMAKLMMDPTLKTFASHLVSAGLTDILLKEQGPFTVFAPTNVAFEQLEEAKRNSFLNPKNKEAVTTLLKSHIVEGNFDSAGLLQKIKTNKGKFALKTIMGDTLMVSKSGNNIVVTNKKGTKSIIENRDINGSNGVVHTLGSLLLLD